MQTLLSNIKQCAMHQQAAKYMCAWSFILLHCMCRISTVTEDTSQGLNCGMYNIAGYVLGTTDGSQANITVSVAGLYDVTNKMNSCSVQAVY